MRRIVGPRHGVVRWRVAELLDDPPNDGVESLW